MKTEKSLEDQKKIIEMLEANGYRHLKLLDTGELAAIMPQLFTVGLFVGLKRYGYRTRFCFATMEDAKESLRNWTGVNDPPGNWIKEKGRIERMNPRYEKGRQ